MSGERNENSTLSTITLITGIGDFLSLFAVLSLVYRESNSVLHASFVVPSKSLGIAIGAIFLPLLLRHFRTRQLIAWSQFISGALSFVLLFLVFREPSEIVLLGILALISALKQIFEAARETHSRAIGESSEQRTLQAQILRGLFGAQLIGPVISFFLIRFFPLYLPFALDAFSFLVAGVLALRLMPGARGHQRSHFLRPFKYIWRFPGLWRVFLLRAVGYWIPVSLFNFILFSVITEHYGLTIIHSAWVYAAIGLGSWIAANTFAKEGLHTRLSDGTIAALSLLALSLTRIGFISIPNFLLGMTMLVLGGICNGMNAVSTQSLRRKLCNSDQFAEVVALELIIARIVDWAIGSLAFLAMTAGVLTFSTGVFVSAGLLAVLAVLHLDRRLRV